MPRPPSILNRRTLLLAGAAVPVLGAIAAARPVWAQQTKFFQIGTGTTGGTYFVIGGILANAISNPPGSPACDRGGSCGVPGLIAVAQASSGATENVATIGDGRLDSGLIQADIAHEALTGSGPFAKRAVPELRAIANLYTETIHVVVRADAGVKSIADLKGKRISLGEAQSGTVVTARNLLALYGLNEKRIKPVFLGPGASADRMASNLLDAFFIVGGYPLPAVADLAARVPIALVPLDDARIARLVTRQPFFTAALIEGDAYPGVPMTRTLGVGANWLTHASADPELIFGITRALWHPHTLQMLKDSHPRGSSILAAQATQGLSVPLHPGAARYYQQAGIAAPQVGSTALPAAAPPQPAKATPAKR